MPEEWDIFSVDSAVRLLPFFLLGYFAATLGGGTGLEKRASIPLGVGVAGFFTLRVIEIFGVVDFSYYLTRVFSIVAHRV